MSTMKTLADLPVGHAAKVLRLLGQGPVRRRLMDMGITRGTSVLLRKTAPLGDPLELTVRGYELTLRREDARQIQVE